MEYVSKKSNEFKGVIRSFSDIQTPQLEIISYGREGKNQEKNNLLIFTYKTEKQSPHLCLYGNEEYKFPFVDFHFPNEKIIVSNYTIRSHVSDTDYLRSWKLLGSKDGGKWRELHVKSPCDDLKNGNTMTYEITNKNNVFSYSTLRLAMTGPSANGDKGLRILNIDFYGFVYTSKYIKTCKMNKSFFLRLKIFFTVIFL